MPVLISISIGPVQDFIAAARKTRDLWFGSEMLGQISKAAAIELVKHSTQMVFPPSAALKDETAAVANKLFCILPDGANAEDIFVKVTSAAIVKLEDYRDQVACLLKRADWVLGNKQIEDFLEVYGAWAAYTEGDYGAARRKVERLLAGRKALRDFAPSVSKPGKPKSSLDPALDTIIDPDKIGQELMRRFGIKRGENLDAISLIKRAAQPQRFVSVSRIAQDPYIRYLKNKAPDVLVTLNKTADSLHQSRSDLCRKFEGFSQYKDFPYDTHLFFGPPSAKEESEILDQEKVLAKQFCEAVTKAPEPYLAILVADGDFMGAAIEHISDPDEHIKLSERLLEFASEAEQTVTKHYGALVYSGGDDVLAFLPLDTALKCANELQAQFQKSMAGFSDGDGTSPTLSAGISIGHYKENLRNLIQWGRAAEMAAKQQPQKNSLAVHMHTRSAGAEYVEAVSSWTSDPFAKRWDMWVKTLKDEKLPKSAIYDLRHIAQEFKDIGHDDVLELEVTRILKRKRSDGGRKKLGLEEIKVMIEAASSDGRLTPKSLDMLVKELIISRHLAKAARTAEGASK